VVGYKVLATEVKLGTHLKSTDLKLALSDAAVSDLLLPSPWATLVLI